MKESLWRVNECAIINLNQISLEKLETRVLSFHRFHAEGLTTEAENLPNLTQTYSNRQKFPSIE
jgi:hypothetical protein